MKDKVILTQKYIPQAVEILQEKFDLVIVEDSNKELAAILQENRDARALISFLSDPIGKNIIDLGENLKIIANYAVGYNNIDFHYAIKRGLYVTHTPDILTDATADLTMALVLAVTRRMLEADEFMRKGEFSGWGANLLLGKELKGCNMGIVGMGRIGRAVAGRAGAFGMNVIYYSNQQDRELEERCGYKFLPLKQLVQESDVLSLHIPYSQEMHHLFDKSMFDLMKKDAVFINTARGALMDEAYLAEKLEKQELFGAGLDVYEFEPKINKKLTQLKNAVVVPHIGSATYAARLGMAHMTIESVSRALKGEKPTHLIPQWQNK